MLINFLAWRRFIILSRRSSSLKDDLTCRWSGFDSRPRHFFFPSFTVFGLLFCFLMVFNLFFTYWLVSLYSYGWLFTAARVVAINVFLVCYRKLLCSWPNFKRHREFFLSEFFSRFVAYPVPSPQIVGTSRKQGEGKIRPA